MIELEWVLNLYEYIGEFVLMYICMVEYYEWYLKGVFYKIIWFC